MQHSPAFLALVEEARRRVTEVDLQEVRRRQTTGASFTLVDVREDHEWEKGRLPGAVHLGRGILERDAEARFPDKAAPLVLYCGGGFRSALAADNLQKMGYTDVVSMDGGWRGWKEAGLPTEAP